MSGPHEPFAYHIDAARRFIRIDYAPPATFERWRVTMDRIRHDPAYVPGYDFLGDRTRVPDAPSIGYVERIVEYLGALGAEDRGRRWANVVGTDRPAVYGMGRMTEMLSERTGIIVRTFTEMDEAIAWLAAEDPGTPSGQVR